MAHFQRRGSRISGTTVAATAGGKIDFSLWGPLNTYLPGNPELNVSIEEPVSAGRFSKGQMKNNARIWVIEKLQQGRWTVIATTAAGEIWDSFVLDVKKAAVAPKPEPVSTPVGGVTWDYLFGAPYSGATVDLNKKRRPVLFPCRMVAALKTAMRSNSVKARPLGDWGLGAVTPHTAGAALDISYFNRGQSLAYANGLMALFIQHRAAMQWGYISYNRMHFSQAGVKPAPGDADHDDHIHIDWLDYGRTQYATEPNEFQYYSDRHFDKDENGKRVGRLMTKKLSGKGQPIAMYWAPGAMSGSLDSLAAALPAFNAAFAADEARYGAMKLADFEALYRPQVKMGMTGLPSAAGQRALHPFQPRVLAGRFT